jgi:hypothetical protein
MTTTMDRRVEELELRHRPAWAGEGEWDCESITYRRTMDHGYVTVDQFINLHPDGWYADVPADIQVRDHEGLTAGQAELVAQDLIQAAQILRTP